uniref:Putative ovule protein n=1 Tax=Solanum chacoense TaxID=4108 RepID=A0A0V0GG05_SOLCH
MIHPRINHNQTSLSKQLETKNCSQIVPNSQIEQKLINNPQMGPIPVTHTKPSISICVPQMTH